MGILLIGIGLLLSGIDIFVTSSIAYPQFQVTSYVGKTLLSPSIKAYTLDNTLSTNVRIDVLPDILGYILIFIGILMIVKKSGKHAKRAIISLIFSLAFAVLLPLSGFITQSSELVIWIIVTYFFHIGFELYMEHEVVLAVGEATDILANKATNTRILFGWWLSAFCRAWITFLDFLGLKGISKVYFYINIFAVLFYTIYLISTKKFAKGVYNPDYDSEIGAANTHIYEVKGEDKESNEKNNEDEDEFSIYKHSKR